MNSQVTLNPATIPSKKSAVSAEEWQLRVDLAAAYRLIALHGWDDLIFTHLSARLPGDEHHFLINPYGTMFDEITASSLVRVDQEGNKLDDSDYDINPNLENGNPICSSSKTAFGPSEHIYSIASWSPIKSAPLTVSYICHLQSSLGSAL